jgi:hypothetical protein
MNTGSLKHVHTTIRPSREQKKLQLLTAATAFRHTQTQVHDTVSSCRLGQSPSQIHTQGNKTQAWGRNNTFNKLLELPAGSITDSNAC